MNCFPKNDKKYSVIVPVYNSEKTIGKCIDSLLNGLPEQTEILLVNDGSTDGSGDICRTYSHTYSAVRLLEKQNGGVSSARNIGLDNASGEFVLFVDSDDYVFDQFWGRLTEYLIDNTVDLLHFGYRELPHFRDDRVCGDFCFENLVDIAKSFLEATKKYIISNVFSSVFKREIIERNNIRFDEMLSIGEDQDFLFRFIIKVKKFKSVSDTLYVQVVKNSTSLSRGLRDNLQPQLLHMSSSMSNALQSSNLPESAKQIHRATVSWVFYRSAYSCFKELNKYELTKSEMCQRIKLICKDYKSKGISPKGIKCLLIAIPVQLKMSKALCLLVRR